MNKEELEKEAADLRYAIAMEADIVMLAHLKERLEKIENKIAGYDFE